MWPHQTVTRTAVYWLSPGVPCTTAPILRCVLVLPPANNRRRQRCGHRGWIVTFVTPSRRLGSSDIWDEKLGFGIVKSSGNDTKLWRESIMLYSLVLQGHRNITVWRGIIELHLPTKSSYKSVMMFEYNNILSARIKTLRFEIVINFRLTSCLKLSVNSTQLQITLQIVLGSIQMKWNNDLFLD